MKKNSTRGSTQFYFTCSEIKELISHFHVNEKLALKVVAVDP